MVQLGRSRDCRLVTKVRVDYMATNGKGFDREQYERNLDAFMGDQFIQTIGNPPRPFNMNSFDLKPTIQGIGMAMSFSISAARPCSCTTYPPERGLSCKRL